MIKKKTKSKRAAKKSGTKKSTAHSKKELNPADVRKDIAKMVESQAETMAQAVIDEGKKGQLATVKYLFEVAEIYPPAPDGGQATADEDCFAKTLLDRLNIPDKPVVHDENDEAKEENSTEKNGSKPAEGDGSEEKDAAEAQG